jgi:hypothetical protein
VSLRARDETGEFATRADLRPELGKKKRILDDYKGIMKRTIMKHTWLKAQA